MACSKSQRVKSFENLPILESIGRLFSDRQIAPVITHSSNDLIDAITEVVYNIANRHIPITFEQETKIRRHRKLLKQIKRRKTRFALFACLVLYMYGFS